MNIDALFDAVAHAGGTIILANRVKLKQEQTASVTAERCGNCNLWMKDGCVPEKNTGRLRSMNDFACRRFVLGYSSKILLAQFEQEMVALQGDLDDHLQNVP